MINSKISLGKLIKLWLPIFFWSFAIFLFLSNQFSIKELIKSIFPILFGRYWFMTVYVFMYCLIPVLNSVVNNIKSKKELLYLGITSLFIIMGGFPKLGLSYIASRLANFCIIYCVGAIIRKKQLLENKKYSSIAKKLFIVLVLIDVLGIFTLVCGGTALNKLLFLDLAKDILIHHWTIIGIAISITVFLLIGSSDIEYNSVINRIAACMFGIYLISDNLYMQNFIWHQLFNMRHALTYPWWLMIVYVLGVTIVVFVCCGILEYIRQLIFSKFERWAYVKGNKFQEKIGLEF